MTLSPIHARTHAEYRHASCRLPIPHFKEVRRVGVS